MKILGIDPGLLATGYGLVETQLNFDGPDVLIETGIVEPDTRESLPKRIQKIYRHLDQIVREFEPGILVLEKLYSHYRHPTTACLLGHVRGVIILLGENRRLRVVEYSPKRIRKALTGNGNASKEQVREFVAHHFKIKASQLTLDASDAIALALGYARMEAPRLIECAQKRVEVSVERSR